MLLYLEQLGKLREFFQIEIRKLKIRKNTLARKALKPWNNIAIQVFKRIKVIDQQNLVHCNIEQYRAIKYSGVSLIKVSQRKQAVIRILPLEFTESYCAENRITGSRIYLCAR